MSLLEQRPAGVRVQASMDGLHIAMPLRSQLAAPRQSLHQAPLSARLGPSALIFLLSMLLTAPTPLLLAQRGRLDAEPLALAACALLAGMATLFANLWPLDVRVRGVDRYPAAEVFLQPHQLTITVAGQAPKVIGLDAIEQVTVDRAGARVRIDGTMVALLPERPAIERAWLGALLDAALSRRGEGDAAAQAAMQQVMQHLSR